MKKILPILTLMAAKGFCGYTDQEVNSAASGAALYERIYFGLAPVIPASADNIHVYMMGGVNTEFKDGDINEQHVYRARRNGYNVAGYQKQGDTFNVISRVVQVMRTADNADTDQTVNAGAEADSVNSGTLGGKDYLTKSFMNQDGVATAADVLVAYQSGFGQVVGYFDGTNYKVLTLNNGATKGSTNPSDYTLSIMTTAPTSYDVTAVGYDLQSYAKTRARYGITTSVANALYVNVAKNWTSSKKMRAWGHYGVFIRAKATSVQPVGYFDPNQLKDSNSSATNDDVFTQVNGKNYMIKNSYGKSYKTDPLDRFDVFTARTYSMQIDGYASLKSDGTTAYVDVSNSFYPNLFSFDQGIRDWLTTKRDGALATVTK